MSNEDIKLFNSVRTLYVEFASYFLGDDGAETSQDCQRTQYFTGLNKLYLEFSFALDFCQEYGFPKGGLTCDDFENDHPYAQVSERLISFLKELYAKQLLRRRIAVFQNLTGTVDVLWNETFGRNGLAGRNDDRYSNGVGARLEGGQTEPRNLQSRHFKISRFPMLV